MDNDRLDLSRRKVLAGIGIAGLGAAGAGLGTTAFLNDTESFENNVLTAGTLNLLIDYHSYWDQGMAGSGSVTGTQDGSGTVSGVLDDVKPGDNGLIAFCPRIDDNPGYLWLCGELTSNDDNGLTEPEGIVDASGGAGQGELAENVEVTVSYCELDDDIADGDDDDPSNDGFEPSDMTQIAEIGTGTLAEFLADIENGVPLDGDGAVPGEDGGFFAPGDQACFDGLGGDVVDNPCLCIDWEVPVEVGNVIQSDSLTFDLEFHAEQCRHNDGTNNPCAGDVTCEPCELPTGVSPSPEISVLSTDASNFPNISLFAQVDTTDGNAGNLTAADFQLCEDGFAQEETVTFQSDRQADIVFVFDDTGSMGEEIQGAKNAINNFVSSVDASLDARYALISYNDAVTVDQDFTSTPGDIQSAVNALSASGGGEFREDNFDALAVATGNEGQTVQEASNPSLSAYRPGAQRVIIDITDAPAHTENTIESTGPPTGTVTELNMSEVQSLLAGYTYIAVSEPVPTGGDEENYSTGDKQALATNVGGIWYDLPQSNSDEFSTLLEEDVVGLLTTTYEISYTTCNDVEDGSARSVNFEVSDPSGTLYGTGGYTAPSP